MNNIDFIFIAVKRRKIHAGKSCMLDTPLLVSNCIVKQPIHEPVHGPSMFRM